MMVGTLILLTGIIGAAGNASTVPAEDLPICKELPDPFRMNDGSYVKTPEDWRKRREEIIALLQDYEYGHLPPPAPASVVKSRSKRVFDGEAECRSAVLGFGPKQQVKVEVGVFVPKGDGPFPAVLAIDPVFEHKGEAAARLCTERGYILAGFKYHDFDQDNKDRSDGMHPLYPEYDWGTLGVWAWGAMRVLDYLLTLPEVDAKHVAITGHSRCGKTALLAAALDERFALAVPHASGCGGSGCFRLENKGCETLQAITLKTRFHYWFHPDFDRFAKKEERLPFDQHFLKALIAPRGLFSQEAIDDLWANPFGTQMTTQAVQPVFDFLKASDRNAILFRYGGHSMTPGDWEALIEFADYVFFGKQRVRDFMFRPFPDLTIPEGWKIPPAAP